MTPVRAAWLRLGLAAALVASPVVAAQAAQEQAHLPDHDGKAARLLAQGDDAAKARAWAAAARAYHELLSSAPGALCAPSPELRIGARHMARLRLRALPPEGRRAFRALFDRVALPLLQRGRRRRDAAALEKLVGLYSPSTHGPAAWSLLADLAWEAGHTARALHACRQALAWGAGEHLRAPLHAKAAICLARLGRMPEAEQELAQARRAGATRVAVAGRELEGRRLDAAWLRSLADVPAPTDAADLRPGRCVWRRPLWHGESTMARQAHSLPWAPLLPVLAGGLVLVHDGVRVLALDEFTGQVAWRYEPAVDRRGAMTLVYGAGGGGPVSVALGASRVYASFLQPTGRPSPRHTRRRIHALDLATGRLACVLGRPSEEEPLLERLSFCSAPVESGGVVYTAAFADSGVCDFYALAFDAATGRLRWHTYLFTGEAPHTLTHGGGHSAPFALADGLLTLASNSGAVACVHARDGSVAWMRRYARTGGFWRTRRGKPLSPWPGWRNRPLARQGVAVVMPSDAPCILGLDAATGELRWQRPRGGHVFLHGAGRGVAVLAGSQVEAVSLATGATVWRRTAAEEVGARGLGAVGAGAVLCPTQRGLLTLDLATGRELGCDPAVFGHVVPSRSVAVATSRHEMAGHVAPGGAAERERARVARDPAALEPRYRLAMALELAGEQAAAAVELRAAVELAAGRHDSLARRVRRAAWRVLLASGERAEAQGNTAEASSRYREAAAAAVEPSRRIRALLGLARCCRARNDVPGLVGLYQQMLARDPDAVYPFSDRRSSAASVFAERELARLIAQHGRQVYAPHDEAAERLLRRAGGDEAARARAVVRRYPNSLAAQRALRAAADEAWRRGAHAEAAACLAALLRRLGPDAPDAAPLAARLAECYERSGDLAAARLLLAGLGTPQARRRLQSPLYARAAAEPDAPARCSVRVPIVHAWTARPAGLTPLTLRGPRAPELDGVVLARDARTLYCLDAATGEERWHVALAAPVGRWSLSARLHGGLVVVYGGSHLYAFEARGGVLRWHYGLGSRTRQGGAQPLWWGRFGQRRPLLPSHVFAGSALFVATGDGRALCLGAGRGERRWETRLPGKPVSALQRLGDRLVVAVGPNCRAAWLEADTGRLLEVVHTLDRAPAFVPTWVGHMLVAADGAGAVAHDARSGEALWSVAARKSGKLAIERFGSRLVLLSSGGDLREIDPATGTVAAQREVGPPFAYLRAGQELFLFCRRQVGGAAKVTVEAYGAAGLAHKWFATLPSANVYDAAATARHLLVSVRGVRRVQAVAPAGRAAAAASVRQVLVLSRRHGAALGTLDIEALRSYSLTTFVPWPRHLVATVHCVVDEVAAQRLVAFGTGEGAPPATAGQADPLLEALRGGRITVDGFVALARRHAERGAFEEGFDALDRAAASEKLSDVAYLKLADAASLVRRAALAAERPEKAIYHVDWELPRPLALDRFRHVEQAEVPGGQRPDRWRGPADASAWVHLAYTPGALCLHVVARDDVHAPAAQGAGDRLEVVLARWQADRRQWSERDVHLALAAGERPELWFGRFPPDARGAVGSAVGRDEARKLTTYTLAVPWRAIGRFKAARGALVDFAVAVHDHDGRGPKGALRWALPEPRLTARLRLR